MHERTPKSKARRRAESSSGTNAGTPSSEPYDLKFVPIGNGKRRAGGWYRELPDDQIEVMSRGHMERVALNDVDPEERAKSVVKDLLKRHH